MGAVAARVRADLRARWVAWLALALAIGIAGTVALTAAAGARRTGTAYDRFLAQGHAEDLYFSIGRPTEAEVRPLTRAVARLPRVEVATPVAAVTAYTKRTSSPYQFGGVEAAYGNTIDRPNVVEGRRPDPDRSDEILVNRALARAEHVRVGDRMLWGVFRPEGDSIDESKVTKVRMRVVGVAVYPNEVIPTAPYDSLPFGYFTPAFVKKYPHRSQEYGFELVRLRGGASDVPAFRRDLNAFFRRHGIDPNEVLFADRAESHAQLRRAIQPQVLALAIFAALVAAAFLMVIVQVLARQIFLDAGEYGSLRALGMTRRQLFATVMARVAAVAIVGAALAVVGAALASPLLPIGPARLAEPHPGFSVNVAVLGLGFLATVVLVVGLTAIPAWRAARAGGTLRARAGNPSRVTATLTATGAPTSAVIGVQSAVHPGQGRSRVPVRSTILVSGLAIALVVGTYAFTTNLDRLAGTPRLYGWDWTFKAGNGFFPVDAKAARAALGKVPDVRAVAGANYGDLTIGGRPTPAVGIDDWRGSVFPTLLEGRAPTNANEVALGTRTLRRAHASVGDTITVGTPGRSRRMQIVGRAVFPKLGAGSFSPTNLGEGAATAASLFADPTAPDQPYNLLLIRLRPGADRMAARARLQKGLGHLEFCGGDPDCVQTASRPGDVSNFTRVRGTSLVLSGALALLALGLLVHVLVSSVRRRRRDLALYKTLGFARRQVAAVTAWQATTMAVLALVVGIPVGLALGSVAWRVFADQLGVAPDSELPVAVLLAIPAVLLLANLVAVVPALLAARTRPATVLRSE